MAHGEQAEGSIWYYAPNKGAAVFFAVAFLASAIWHGWQSAYVTHHTRAAGKELQDMS